MQIASDPIFSSALRESAGVEIPSLELRKTLGHLLCVVDLVAVHRTEDISSSLRDSRESVFGDYSPGRFAWELRDARRFSPIPWKGSQGFFFVPDAAVHGAFRP